MEAVAESKRNNLVRSLETIALEIEREFQLIEETNMERYERIGSLIAEAYDGHFQGNRKGLYDWTERRFGLKHTQAKRYYDYFNDTKTLTNRSESERPKTIMEFERRRGTNPGGYDSDGLRAKIAPIFKKIDYEALANEKLKRVDELAEIRKLAEQIIDIGYRALAIKLHPDKRDGSRQAMQRLNAARERLRRAL